MSKNEGQSDNVEGCVGCVGPLGLLLMVVGGFLGVAHEKGGWATFGWILCGAGFLFGGIYVAVVLASCEESAKEWTRKHRLDDRAKHTGKRITRWLDKKFPADDQDTQNDRNDE